MPCCYNVSILLYILDCPECYDVDLSHTGWLLDPEARPSFEDLETRMTEFLSDPLRYILTVVSILTLFIGIVYRHYCSVVDFKVDDRLETYANLPTNILNTGESPYESPFLLSGGDASGYEMPSPANTLTQSATAQEVNMATTF